MRTAAGAITTFDAPHAGRKAYQGTLAMGINFAGVVTGYYFDGGGDVHGFVRSADGTITEFDFPGTRQGTVAKSINAEGSITGYWGDTVIRGFVRSPAGKMAGFTVSDAIQTVGQGINNSGTTTGYSVDSNNVTYGLVRASNGEITTFYAPGAGTGPGGGTFPAGVNNSGTIAGVYADAGGVEHGFLRSSTGVINKRWPSLQHVDFNDN